MGAYGGRRDIMDAVSPSGPIYQAGTLSGNPMAMAAGLTLLKELKSNKKIYEDLERISALLAAGLEEQLKRRGIPASVNQVGSMFTLFFTDRKVLNLADAKTADTVMFGKYFNAMLQQGVYLAPSQFEALFVSHAITQEVAERILQASEHALNGMGGVV